MIEFIGSALPGVLLVKPQVVSDRRGRFVKLFHPPSFAAEDLITEFAEHYYSESNRGVVRGMHFQTPPAANARLVVCLVGAAADVVVDLRSASATYGQVASFQLNGDTPEAVYVPAGCAHGFAALRDGTLMSYMVSTPYSPEHDRGIAWNSINYAWPFADPVCSGRDRSLPHLDQFHSPF